MKTHMHMCMLTFLSDHRINKTITSKHTSPEITYFDILEYVFAFCLYKIIRIFYEDPHIIEVLVYKSKLICSDFATTVLEIKVVQMIFSTNDLLYHRFRAIEGYCHFMKIRSINKNLN